MKPILIASVVDDFDLLKTHNERLALLQAIAAEIDAGGTRPTIFDGRQSVYVNHTRAVNVLQSEIQEVESAIVSITGRLSENGIIISEEGQQS